MTDIVERLQTLVEHHKEALIEMNVPLTEAKAEIELLREENERLRTEVEAWRKQYPHAGFDGSRIVTPVGSEIVRMMERVIENAQAQPQEKEG